RAPARGIGSGLREASRGKRVAASAAGSADRRACHAAAEERAGARPRRGDDRPTEGDGAGFMSDSIARVTIRILEKEYHVACPADEQPALLASADLLNRKMREIRDSGKVVGLDRV